MSTTPNIGLEILTEGQANKEASISEAHQQLDVLVQGGVKDRDLAAPPVGPSEGDRYLVAASATGAWTGEDGKIAHYRNSAWTFITPKEGWRFYVEDEDKIIIYDGLNWSTVGGAMDVKEGGSSVVAEASALNFTGTGVSVTDGGGGRADIAISGGGSGLTGHQGLWEQIDRQEFSGVSSVVIGGGQTPGDYDAYLLLLLGVIVSSDGESLSVWASDDGGSTKILNYISQGHQIRSGGADSIFASESVSLMFSSAAIDADNANIPYSAEVFFSNPGSSFYKSAFIRHVNNNNSVADNLETQHRCALVEHNGVIDSFVLEVSNGTISGSAVLIGLKKSETGGRLIEETGTGRTLSGDDNNRIVDFTNTGMGVTVTVPDSLPQGLICRLVNQTGGSITISAGGSLTIIGETSIVQNQGAELWMITGTTALVSAL